MRRIISLLLALALLCSLAACGSSKPAAPEEETAVSDTELPADGASDTESVEPEPEPAPEPEPYAIYDPTVMPEGGSRDRKSVV